MEIFQKVPHPTKFTVQKFPLEMYNISKTMNRTQKMSKKNGISMRTKNYKMMEFQNFRNLSAIKKT
jgi:hypothetical protein